jgi:hypothetical protein
MTRETHVEGYLRARVQDVGGLCVKLHPAGVVGIPDRLVLLPGGRVVFAEVKKPQGGVVGRLQYVWRDRLIELGFVHRFVFTREDVEDMLAVLR